MKGVLVAPRLPAKAIRPTVEINQRCETDVERGMLDAERQRIVDHLHLQPLFPQRGRLSCSDRTRIIGNAANKPYKRGRDASEGER